MVSNNLTRYPFPLDIPRKFATELFQILDTGENATSIWVGSAGRRLISQFLINHPEEIVDVVPNFKKYLLVYVEPLDLTENTQSAYLKLMGQAFIQACKQNPELNCEFNDSELELFDSENPPYAKLLEGLKRLFQVVIDQNIEVVLLLGEFDELEFINAVFSNNLRSVWNKFNGQLHYVFLIKDLRLIFGQNQYGEELRYLIFQNLLFWPLQEENDDYFISYFENKTGFTLSPELKQLVKDICDGHPYFLKLAIDTLSKKQSSKDIGIEELGTLIRSNYEIRAVSDRILEVLTEEMKNFLTEITIDKVYELPNKEELLALESLGLISKSEDGSYQPFCLAFRDAVLKTVLPRTNNTTKQSKGLVFESDLNSISFDGKPLEDDLTRQEFELLSYLIKSPNKLHSRDEIAEALWGKDSFEKYSDWAIDQLMSKLRKKLTSLKVKDNTLVTVRGRGYKLIVNS